MRPILLEADDEAQDKQWQWGVDPELATRGRAELSERILAVNGELVEPDVARHMFAVVESDPFPAVALVKFRSVDVMYDLGTLPSPVDPKMRNLEFCCCWSLGSKG